jgi:hypothetical protein
MAIDIRATVTCSLGTLISGSISDDYLQGNGLVKTKGSRLRVTQAAWPPCQNRPALMAESPRKARLPVSGFAGSHYLRSALISSSTLLITFCICV